MKRQAAAASSSSSTASSFTSLSADTASSSNASTSSDAVDGESRSFIMMVQHLIERCLTFYLDEQECAEELSRHARIDPIITRTVWKELEKANEEFFERYYKSMAVFRMQPLHKFDRVRGPDTGDYNESKTS